MPRKRVDLTGQAFGKLAVVRYAGKTPNGDATYLCACSCGNKKIVRAANLRNGTTNSCGCLFREWCKQSLRPPLKTHGLSDTPEYRAFSGARHRCTNTNNRQYHDYGGRGIKFNFPSFEEFIKYVGKKPSPNHSLDRIDVNGNYEPGNLRWADAKTQVANRRIKRIEDFSTEEIFAELQRRNTKDNNENLFHAC
jgi:hypothetical protein